MTDALPAIDRALLPASVRAAGPEAQKLYNVALSFEQLLTQQLAKSLTATLHTSGGDDDSAGGDASTNMAEQMLPTALAQGMTQAGGLGLADQLYEALGGSATDGDGNPGGPMSILIEHLARQLGSSRRMLEIVITQREAIRRQDVEAVLASLAEVQAEMGYRARLEQERDTLLAHAAAERGAVPETLDLDAMLVGRPADECLQARTMSAELRGLIVEVGRIHDQNRVLIRQELTFLDHLMRVISGTPQGGYSSNGWLSVPQTATVVDAKA